MPTIYSSSSGTSNDGLMFKTNQSSWSNARDATSATLSTATQSTTAFTLVGRGPSRGGGSVYSIYRSFMVFDTSGITGTVSSATIKIRGSSGNDGSVIAVKSTAFGGDGGTSLASGDFDAISGWSSGSSLAGSATVYGSQILTTSWNTGSYNDFTTTSDLRTDMQNEDVVIICFMDYTNDYLNSALTSNGNLNIGGHFANYPGTSRDPKIDYTLAATGFGHEVNNVASGSIAKVKGVATASIAKVIGVD